MKRILTIALALALAGCLRQAEERTLGDLDVGAASAGDVSFLVVDGLAHVRSIDAGSLALWAQAPVVEIEIEPGTAATPTWELRADNITRDAVLVADPPIAITEVARTATSALFRITLAPGEATALTLGPPDAAEPGPVRFAVMGDIQTALDDVHEVFAAINAQPDLRFVVSTGDLVEEGERWEYELLTQQYQTLELPYYATAGNHEMVGDPALWREYFGRFNVHFAFKGTYFSLVDSGNATVDPLVYTWLDDWMARAGDAPHVFLTHIPPLDPVGVRSGSFRSRKEASKLLARLARGGVDLTLYGHIHSYYEFDNAGMAARISGGGGAWPEKLDGIGRHFLVVTADPAAAGEPHGGFTAVDAVRVDE